MGRKAVVVLPVYNTAGQVAEAVAGLGEYVDQVIVVDDCSRDGTKDVVSDLHESRVILLQNDVNMGVGGATKHGLRKGLEVGGDILVKYDHDGQMDPERMKELISPLLEGYDYAKGNRFLHTRELVSMPIIRLIGNFILTFVTKLASGYWQIFDPQNGYLALSREILEKLPIVIGFQLFLQGIVMEVQDCKE